MDSKAIFDKAAERYAICKECPFFNSLTRTCSECGCLMLVKTKVPMAECPQHKWGKMEGIELPAE